MTSFNSKQNYRDTEKVDFNPLTSNQVLSFCSPTRRWRAHFSCSAAAHRWNILLENRFSLNALNKHTEKKQKTAKKKKSDWKQKIYCYVAAKLLTMHVSRMGLYAQAAQQLHTTKIQNQFVCLASCE